MYGSFGRVFRNRLAVVAWPLIFILVGLEPAKAVPFTTTNASFDIQGPFAGTFELIFLPTSGDFTGAGTYTIADVSLKLISSIPPGTPPEDFPGSVQYDVRQSAPQVALPIAYSLENLADEIQLGGNTFTIDNYNVVVDQLTLAIPAGESESTSEPLEVTVSAVPEPSTWAMLLIGFAGIGFAGWGRSRCSVSHRACAEAHL
jgi:hypothetical protein